MVVQMLAKYWIFYVMHCQYCLPCFSTISPLFKKLTREVQFLGLINETSQSAFIGIKFLFSSFIVNEICLSFLHFFV